MKIAKRSAVCVHWVSGGRGRHLLRNDRKLHPGGRMLKVAVPFLDSSTLALFDSSQQREAENGARIERVQPLLIMI